MKSLDALQVVVEELGDGLAVSCNGFVSRELFLLRDRPGNLYLLGSMGLAAAVGMGIALSRPGRRVAVLDGDGNALMGLGGMANVAAAAPRNLLHVILDNGAYASTGAQGTVSRRVPLEEVARACGYARACRVRDAESLRRAWREEGGPACLLVEVEPSDGAGLPRVEIPPPELARRFREAM
jgi:thiamine pyrophosphate-dependent acetolactate synthase large subunit-like protein